MTIIRVDDPESGESVRLPDRFELGQIVQQMDNAQLAELTHRVQEIASNVYAMVQVCKAELLARMEAQNATALPVPGYEVVKETGTETIVLPGIMALEDALQRAGIEMPRTTKGKPAVWMEPKADLRLLTGLRKYGGEFTEIIDANILEKPTTPKVRVKKMGG